MAKPVDKEARIGDNGHQQTIADDTCAVQINLPFAGAHTNRGLACAHPRQDEPASPTIDTCALHVPNVQAGHTDQEAALMPDRAVRRAFGASCGVRVFSG